MKKPTICYTAIFKDESKNVYRCLNSLKPIINYVCICDTGSTDNTVELIHKWCQENNIPGHVGQEPFKNFGYNRTVSVEMAQKHFPKASYLLLLDADMILKIEPGFRQKKKQLDKDRYLFKQVNNSLEYWNVRMIKASLKWECVGVTHEYWDSPDSKTQENFKGLWIDDIGDGGAKKDKYERDERLLLSQLYLSDGSKIGHKTKIEDLTPLQVRYLYYLGQTYECIKNYVKAIYWYRIRARAGQFYEEAYMAQYKIGECYRSLEQNAEAIDNYLLAYDMNPGRAEPLYKVCKLYRERGKNLVSYQFAQLGKKISVPENQHLFIEYPVYEYLFDYEISIVAWYNSLTRNEAYEALYLILDYSLKKIVWHDHLWAAYMNYVTIDMFEYKDSFAKFFDKIDYNILAGVIEKCNDIDTKDSNTYGGILLKKLDQMEPSKHTKDHWDKTLVPIRQKWKNQ